jgi:hypothetical protein
VIIARLGGKSPQQHGPQQGACSLDLRPSVYRRHPRGVDPQLTAAAQLAQRFGVVVLP